MTTSISRYRDDLEKLIKLGQEMQTDLHLRSLEEEGKLDKDLREVRKKIDRTFEKKYQHWYSETHALLRQLLPERITEFESLYLADPKRKTVDITSYKIQDWLMGMRATKSTLTGEKHFDDFAAVVMRFSMQLDILKSVEVRFESSLLDIRQVVQADLHDSELDGSQDLRKKGFLRAAGVVAGVVLEKHLSHVCHNHKIALHKKNPTISDYNDALKENNVLDVADWRFVQRLGDLRNLCGHNKETEPTEDQVAELINGVGKILKTLY
ncbi:MAG: hypothetical protein ABSE25_00720 [Syntrophorhabdales bacterium]|jgi:hypothetical protein